ncbi:serine/threonine protein kinase, partial [Streptomyces seoulensis]
LALVVVLAVLVGGGTALALLKWDARRGQGDGSAAHRSGATTPAPSRTAKTAPGGLPAGWVRKKDPYGFSVSLPGADWKRVVSDPALRQVDYTPDGGEHFIRIAIDDSPDFPSAHDHQLDLADQLHRLVDYRQVNLAENTFRDRPGSRWEYTWTALAKDTAFPGPRHAVEETYFSREGVEYAIYMSSPAADWPRTEKQFKTVLQSWRPGAD